MARVLVLYFDDLTPGVRPAVLAHEVRALGRMTLRALHGRDRVELPISRATAARLAARSFPFQVRHLIRLRNTRARARVFVLTAGRTDTLAFGSENPVRRTCALGQL